MVGKAVIPCSLESLAFPLLLLFFPTTLEAELEELRCHLGEALDFVGARISSLAERLDNAMCRVRIVVSFGVRRGAVTALLVGEIWSSYSLREVFGPPRRGSREDAGVL